MEKEGKISDKFGQVWASLGKLGQVSTRQQIIKMGKKAEKGRKNKKREKNLSGNWEGGGESRV